MNEREIIVTGASGMLGRAVVRVLQMSDAYTPIALNRYSVDLTQRDYGFLKEGSPIINCAGIVRGRKDIHFNEIMIINSLLPHELAKKTRRLIQVSTDCVFDGGSHSYLEYDSPMPTDDYSISKLVGEVYYSPHLTVRTSFIGFGQRGLLRWLLHRPQGAKISGYCNWLWNGLYVDTVARELVRLLDDPMTGILHIEGPETSKYAVLAALAEAIRPDINVEHTHAVVPKNMILKSERIDWSDRGFSWTAMIEEIKDYYEANEKLPW